MCPSAPPEIEGAVAFGVVDHSADTPEVLYFEEPLPVTPELLALASPLRPTEVFRFGATCQQRGCAHWGGKTCNLAERIVDGIEPGTLAPICQLRPTCRWFAERGARACVRCAAIVTQDERPTEAIREAAKVTPAGTRALRVVDSRD
jgi:hypothetical protein